MKTCNRLRFYTTILLLCIITQNISPSPFGEAWGGASPSLWEGWGGASGLYSLTFTPAMNVARGMG